MIDMLQLCCFVHLQIQVNKKLAQTNQNISYFWELSNVTIKTQMMNYKCLVFFFVIEQDLH